MSYRVFWSPYAEQLLDQLIEDSHDPQLIALTAKQIDRLLHDDASNFGESRYDSVRIGFVHPLAVQIDLLEDVSTVIVDVVWRTDRNK